MKNRLVFYSVLSAVIGWGLCFEAFVLTAQEQNPPPQEPQRPQFDRPARPKGQQGGPRPERQGDHQGERKGPQDGERQGEGGNQGRPNPAAILMRMSGRMLIVAPNAEAQVHQDIEEDLTTMLHLLERAVDKDLGNSDEEINTYRNIPVVLTSDSRAMYLDDYGVMFSMRTSQTLFGQANQEQKPVNQPTPRGTQWERARQELFGGERGNDGQRDFRPSMIQYDAAKVAALKESMLGLLRDATNLRHLKADQTVAIVLAGSPSFNARPNLQSGEEGNRDGSPLERFRSQMNRSTFLVMRAKKSDIDSFAKGAMTAEQFKGKVSIVNN